MQLKQLEMATPHVGSSSAQSVNRVDLWLHLKHGQTVGKSATRHSLMSPARALLCVLSTTEGSSSSVLDQLFAAQTLRHWWRMFRQTACMFPRPLIARPFSTYLNISNGTWCASRSESDIVDFPRRNKARVLHQGLPALGQSCLAEKMLQQDFSF